MDYEFESFNLEGGRFTPYLTIGEAGGIGVSYGFTKKYETKKAVGVRLFYDRKKKAVGVKFLNQNEPGMVPLKLGAKGGGFLNAKAFLVKYDIDPKQYKGKYTAKEVVMPNEGTVYVFELKEKSELK